MAVASQCDIQNDKSGFCLEEATLASHRAPQIALGSEVEKSEIRHNVGLVLVVCPGGDEHTVLCVLSGQFAHGPVDLTWVFLCAVRHGSGDSGAQVYKIEREEGGGRQADDGVRRGSEADRWCHGGRKEGREELQHGNSDGGTMLRDKKDCMTKVREERKEERKEEEEGEGHQVEVLGYTLAIFLQHLHRFRSGFLVQKVNEEVR